VVIETGIDMRSMWEMAWQELHANICFVSEALITPCVLECGGVGLIAAEAYIYILPVPGRAAST